MELGFKFQRQLQGGGGGGGDGGEDSPVSLDDAYLNNLCPGVSFRALLTYSSSEEGPPYKFISDAPGGGVAVPRKEKDRCRRKKRGKGNEVGEKTRCLRKLLPWEGKMDMGTVLEEAYKYIKFLRAQVSALQSMPRQSTHTSGGGGGGGELGRLNRQQLMQVVVNSPVAQRQLYTNECCIYSVEQQI
ncbi:hypothetical protein MIMGU_mgv1a023763mg [Erythranthe guttata]|uniref:BHLH domain-containing protein n=1 Tax=Erythranthe guttata TaxID=4155 RepID=A0A022RSX8_ERYGU|nr:PREDICTED: transcription factor bHLH117 [Erythranthe guttata]EYU43096.1 hypothetical protein MIMGU_mgv1a023763mg [Erythranthe guttata]|eukprot:XP_012830415.1 PREDICTED: transcription factor bHLH117 [Erythranthe guttata]